MKRFILLFNLLLVTFCALSKNEVMCIVNRNEVVENNVVFQNIEEIILDFSIEDEYIYSDEECFSINPFDNILGLSWGMGLGSAITKLNELGLSKYETINDNDGLSIFYHDKVFWDGILYDHLILNSFVSNKQKCYLSEITFSKKSTNHDDAKRILKQIAVKLRWRFGTDMVKEDLDENGNLKYYVEEDLRDSEGSGMVLKRVIGIIGYSHEMGYIVALRFTGYMEASKRVYYDQ